LIIASEMARTFTETQGVIGWQIDNEFTLGSSQRCYCNYCQAGFQTWLRSRYGTLDNLNQSWGTVFWSQTYTDFSQIPVPLPSGGDPNPGLALDYDRYQSYANVSFQQEQLDMLRKTCPGISLPRTMSGWWTRSTCAICTRSWILPPSITTRLLRHADGTARQDGSSAFVSSSIALGHDLARSVKGGKPFMIMEEQSGKAGQKTFSPQPEKGQARLWTYQAIAHGAMGVNYFRWDTATFGAEEYWHGILNHDRSRVRLLTRSNRE
jgi:beta-galactosidase